MILSLLGLFVDRSEQCGREGDGKTEGKMSEKLYVCSVVSGCSVIFPDHITIKNSVWERSTITIPPLYQAHCSQSAKIWQK
jgi:hypothetical protein